MEVTVLLAKSGAIVTLLLGYWATDQDVERSNSSSTNAHVSDFEQGQESLHLERFIELVGQTYLDLQSLLCLD